MSAKTIAIIGVSGKDPTAPANTNFDKLKAAGFDVIPVNPNLREFHGQICYAQVSMISEMPEAALIFTTPEITPKVVKECVDLGVKNIWIHKGLGPGSVSAEATALLRAHPEINLINGACPLMFVRNADWFHRGYRKILSWSNGLPG